MVQPSSTDCYSCRKHRGEIAIPGGAIYRDELVYAGHLALPESGPVYLGYLIVETIRHTPSLADLTDAEAQAVGLLNTRLARALKASENAEHVYALVLGHHVPHFHTHIVARYPGAPRQYWGIHVDEWPDAPHGDAAVVEALCARLRAALTA